MNYYPFHIGDYVSATRHLSWEEDAAFRRLLDVYYTTEKPIPADFKQACRLVLATTESQREAVKTVLEEFFHLTDVGWMNQRADAEIDVMLDKQQKQRDKANKRWHMPRPEHGISTALPQHEENDAAALKTDANAMPPTPIPTPTPTPNINNTGASARRGKPAVVEVSDVDPDTWRDFQTLRKAKHAPVTQTAINGIRREAEKAGLTLDAAIRVCCTRGWTGFKAEWVEKSQNVMKNSTTETFSERDERLARERVAAFAPGVAAKPRTQGTQGGTTSGMVFDVTSRLIQGQSNEVAA